MNNIYAAPAADLAAAPHGPTTITALAWSGRIGRLRYLAYLAGVMLACATASTLLLLASPTLLAESEAQVSFQSTMLALVAFLAFLVIARRRLQDFGGGSGWLLCLLFIPLVGMLLVFRQGDEGENKFGPVPPPNTAGVKWLACFWPLLIIGVSAAIIAIPAKT